MAHVLLAIGQRVRVCHVHHGLRGGEADADLRFAAALARRLGVPFHGVRVDASRESGESPEARARRLRYEALERIRREAGCDWVATAHTREDQAETLLLRAARGTGPVGLAGIDPIDARRRLLRPMLETGRGELRSYLRSRGLTWREDASNADLSIPRNRLRADVLPVLEALHPGAADRLADLARSARDLRAWVRDEVEGMLAAGVEAGDGGYWIERERLLAAPESLRAEALGELLRSVGMAERVSRVHLDRVADFLAKSARGKRLSLPLDCVLLSDGPGVWLGREPGPRFPGAFEVRLSPPRALARPERGLRLTWSRSAPEEAASGLWIGDPGAVPLVARSPRSGDRLSAGGNGAPRPLKDLFVRARWSYRDRARALVVELGGEVVWVPGLASARAPGRGNAAREGWLLRAERLSGLSASC
jgi:tRNA(Ile)-lysidine synthase